MNRSAQARQAAEQGRQEQVAIKAGFLAQFVPTWDLLDWDKLDQTTPAWVKVVMAIIRPWRQASANVAARRYAEYRLLMAANPLSPGPALEFVDAPDPLGGRQTISVPATLRFTVNEAEKAVVDWTDADKAAQRSLLVTGPGNLKRQAALGRTEQQAKNNGLVTASGAASRQVLNGGRATTLTLVGADDQAVGWARLTDGNPCAFCALLASRGPVYKTAETVGFKAHDHCACTAIASFSRSQAWPGQARDYERLYRGATKGFHGQDAINAFRRAYEQQQRDNAQPQPQTA